MNLPQHLIGGVHRARVCLDGKELADVIEAHTGEGWLIRCKRDEAGGLIVTGDEFATERLTGVVTAEPL